MQEWVAEAGEAGRGVGRGTVRGANYASRSHPGVAWRKSSWSAYNGSCVEVAVIGAGEVGIRDSKAGPDGGVLTLSRAEWSSFLRALQA